MFFVCIIVFFSISLTQTVITKNINRLLIYSYRGYIQRCNNEVNYTNNSLCNVYTDNAQIDILNYLIMS